MAAPETSVIIRTFNEEKHLPNLLEALRLQSYRDIEIIVVDSGSVDRTCDIASREADKLLRIESHDFTFGYSLNVGIRESEGQYIAIVSAHTVPVNEEWLRQLVAPLRDKQTAMCYGQQLGAPTSKFSEIQDFRRSFGTERMILRWHQFFANNANSAVRRDLWEHHCFDETLPGLEDIEWAKHWVERGYQVVYEPKAALYHIHEESWQQIRNRYYREALSAHWIGLKKRVNVLHELAREMGYFFFDLGSALLPNEDRIQGVNGLIRCVGQIALFRWNKAIGSIKGLMDGAVMENPAKKKSLFFDKTCQAVVIQGPKQATLKDVPIPEVKPGDILIRVAYQGVCATDIEIFEGTLGYYRGGTARYPIVPGHECSGWVVSSGSNVTHVSEGDHVVVECIQSCGKCSECRRGNNIGCPERSELGVIRRDGGYSEYLVVPSRFVHQVPFDLDLAKACLCEPLAVVLKSLKRLSRAWLPEPQVKRCAVVGAGPLDTCVRGF